MASKKKAEKIEKPEIIEQPVEEIVEKQEEIVETVEKPVEKPKKEEKKAEKEPKYKIGSIVYVSREAEADLNGFKLFPQYKKYTYTVEAYDGENDVNSLRRLNLSLKLKEADIVAPNERETSPLVRKQY